MTNEEIVSMIRQGDNGYLPQLWEAVRKFIEMQARKYFYKFENPAFEIADLVNEAYFGFLYAVKTFSCEKGSFLTLLDLTIRSSFAAVSGLRTRKRDPLDASLSLDAPVGDSDDSDTLLDFMASDMETLMLESIFNRDLRTALDAALSDSAIVSHQARRFIELHFYFGLSYSQIGAKYYCSRAFVREAVHEAFIKIRTSHHGKTLREFLPKSMPGDYQHAGYQSWKNDGMSQELYFLISREEKESENL